MMREARRLTELFAEEAVLGGGENMKLSEKLAWEDVGGRGERDREVERELCVD